MNQNQLSGHAALLLRVSMGVLFLAHGLILKVLTFTPAGTAAYFASIGYPPVMGYVVIAAEIAGGLALIAGVQVRLVSLAFVPLRIGAALQHLGNGWTFSNPGGGWDFPVFWTVLLFVQALLGAGRFSLARLAGIERKASAAPALT
ncbi:MAG TPA: DoxX family protein [Allosphingosinicella sp.]